MRGGGAARSTARCSRPGQPVLDQRVQSSSSAVAPRSSCSRVRSTSSATARARCGSAPASPSSRAGSSTACRTSSRDGVGSRCSAWASDFSRTRSCRARRRTSPASRLPSGPVSSASARAASMWSTWSGSVLSRLSTARSASISGRAAGSRTRGSSSLATSTGTPAPPSERRSGGMLCRPERTRTAISSQGMPSSRCARRSRSARCSASPRSLSKDLTTTRPSPCSPATAVGDRNASRATSGMVPGRPILPATRWAAVRMRGPKRRVVPSATTSAGRPSACANVVGKSRMPLTSAPRNA